MGPTIHIFLFCKLFSNFFYQDLQICNDFYLLLLIFFKIYPETVTISYKTNSMRQTCFTYSFSSSSTFLPIGKYVKKYQFFTKCVCKNKSVLSVFEVVEWCYRKTRLTKINKFTK